MTVLRPLVAALAAASFAVCTQGQQTVSVQSAAQLLAAAPTLGPGDTLLLAPGAYPIAKLELDGLQGAPGQWITIRTSAGRATLLGTAWQNVIEIRDCAFLRLQDLDVTHVGGMSGIDGAKFMEGTSSHDVTFSNCRFHTLTGNGLSSQADLVERLRVVDCEFGFIGGTGLYLGYTAPLRRMVDTEIRSCWIHDVSMNLVTGQPTSTGYGIQVKALSHGTRIVDCVLENVGGTDRAAIALYYPAHAGAAPEAHRNLVANTLIRNARKEGLYVCNGAVIENNVILDTPEGLVVSTTDGCAIDRLDIRHNTVHGSALRAFYLLNMHLAQPDVRIHDNVGSVTAPGAFAWRLPVGTGSAVFTANAALGAVHAPGVASGWFAAGPAASAFVAPTGPAPDLRPKTTGLLLSAPSALVHPVLDHAGHPRTGPVAAGALQPGAPPAQALAAGGAARRSVARVSPALTELAAATGGLATFTLRSLDPATQHLALLPSLAGPDAGSPLGFTPDAFTTFLWSADAAPFRSGFLHLVSGPAVRTASLLVPSLPGLALDLHLHVLELDAALTLTGCGGDARLKITP